MSYDGFYGELSTRGTANDALNQITDLKNQVVVLAAEAEGSATSSEDSATTSSVFANTAVIKASEASISASSASASENEAKVSEINSGISAQQAEINSGISAQQAKIALVATSRFCGVSTTAPISRLDGSPLQEADEYQNSVDHQRYSWTGTVWVALNGGSQLLEERLSNSSDNLEGDSMLAVKQPFAGSVARTQHSKNADVISSMDYMVGDGSDEHVQYQALLVAGAGRTIHFVMNDVGGVYASSKVLRLFANTRITSDPGVELKRLGNTDSWMFVNGVVKDLDYATAYNGDSNIHIIGNTFNLNGIPGVRSAAALVFGHSHGIHVRDNTFKNGHNSHNIEINANSDGFIEDNLFLDQTYSNTVSSFECVNVDFSGRAGFPAFGTYDGTPDKNLVIRNNTFRNVQGGVSSHSAPPTGWHTHIKVYGNTFENIGGRAIRAQGWKNCEIKDNTFINIGQEAVSVLSGSGNIITGNIILGASQASSGSSSAIRLDGDENLVSGNIIDNTGYVNQYSYPVSIAAGSRNIVNTKGAKGGSSFASGGMVLDSGTLTNIDGRTLLFSGDAVAPVTITLLDNINFFEHLEVTTGQVANYTFQSHILRPFVRGLWTTTDKLAIQTFGGVTKADIVSPTSINVLDGTLTNVQHIRHIYGILP